MEVNARPRRAWLPATAALIIAMNAFATYSSTAVAADIKATLKIDRKASSMRSAAPDSGSFTVGAGKSFGGRVTTSNAAITAGQIHEWATPQNAPAVIALTQAGDAYRIPADAKPADAQLAIFEDAALPVLPLFFVASACIMVPLGLMRIMLSHGVLDTDIARILPSVTTALKSWNGRDLPPESAYAALIADLRASREEETPAGAAMRLN